MTWRVGATCDQYKNKIHQKYLSILIILTSQASLYFIDEIVSQFELLTHGAVEV